jgi:hypothetical protein
MKSTQAIACGLILSSLVASAQTAAQTQPIPVQVGARTVVRLAPFTAVELSNGTHVILRYGPSQRVTFLRGSPDYTRLSVAAGGRLVIHKCATRCPRGYRPEIEIVTPTIARISVANGGLLQALGNFPRQPGVGVAVSHGGTIDIRSMPVESVTAAVEQGGRIFTMPQRALVASVSQGGNITYWAPAQMQLVSSVNHGGVVTKGTAADAYKPLSELSPSIPSLPHIRPAPPIRSL